MTFEKIVFIYLTIICSISAISLQEFMALSDQEIWNKPQADIAKYFGNCAILDSRSQPNACDYYIKINISSGAGLPNGVGSGCLKAPTSSCPTCTKNVNTCWTSSGYDTYDNTWPICTNDHKKNAANMIRIGVLKGACDFANYTVSNLTQNNSTCNCSANNQSILSQYFEKQIQPTNSDNVASTQLRSLLIIILIICSCIFLLMIIEKVRDCRKKPRHLYEAGMDASRQSAQINS